ncbi:MAG: ATP synthase F1 subunit delta [Bdellovibrionaceae bacterium]|nr:ATP synthase F1 subunit delta [Pseudobdellovibrionaceae bacterium]MBX3033641.1 ATP synthase F1 subunit delta [Pseudobdellovibrionaceae bacterium]
MSVSEVSRRYAKALLSLTKQKGVHIKTLDELRVVRGVLEKDGAINEYFQNPLISPDQKLQVVKTAFAGRGLSEEVLNLLILLAEKHRIGQFMNVVDAYQEAIDEEEGLTRGVVRAAKPLSPEGQKSLEEKISATLKKKIVLTFKEDPTILGGVVAQVGGWTFDDSLETHLKKMNEELNRSAN